MAFQSMGMSRSGIPPLVLFIGFIFIKIDKNGCIFQELVSSHLFTRITNQMYGYFYDSFLPRLFLMFVFDLSRISGKYTGGALAFAATGAFVFSG